MPSLAEHNDKYADNMAFLVSNGGLISQNSMWASVVAFYAAVHLVERLAAHEGVHNRCHVGTFQSRQLYLAGHPKHSVILADFSSLRTASEIARYQSIQAFDRAFPGKAVEIRLINRCLANIEKHVTNFFAAQGLRHDADG